MEWFTCRRRILRGRYSTSSHSASDAAIAFPRGATPCAKSGVGWAGRRADPLEPGGSIVGRTKRRGLKATVLSCANGAMTDRLSQCKKLEHGLPGLNLGIRLKPFRTSHCGIASASLACPTGAFTACPAHVVYGYWPRVILVSVSSTPRRHEHARAQLTRDRCARLDRSAIVGKGRGPARPAVPLQGIPRRKRRNALLNV